MSTENSEMYHKAANSNFKRARNVHMQILMSLLSLVFKILVIKTAFPHFSIQVSNSY